MNSLTNKRILLGITGGIAAYKGAELCRRLREHGADVRVAMSQAACEFITPLTMQAVSGHPVHTRLLNPQAEAAMSHIELARWCDVILVAPATAHFIARLAHGLADDLLSTVCLAADVPLLVSPAMNRNMWSNAATADNVRILEQRGVNLIAPASGEQACGETGPGRMPDPDDLVAAVDSVFSNRLLSGRRVLITAGPTREPLDPVRFISNRSSGRMGYAVCRAAIEAGGSVTLISGPVTLNPPAGARVLQVETAAEMFATVHEEAGNSDIFIATAAVADYGFRQPAEGKIKKDDERITVELERNPDILGSVAALSDPPFTVGFAAETGSLQDNARDKLQKKQLNMIAANLVGDGIGFDSLENSLEVYWPEGQLTLEHSTKERLARQLIRLVAEKYNEKNTD